MWSACVTFGKPETSDCARQGIADEAVLGKGRAAHAKYVLGVKKNFFFTAVLRIISAFLSFLRIAKEGNLNILTCKAHY